MNTSGTDRSPLLDRSDLLGDWAGGQSIIKQRCASAVLVN